MSTNIKLSVPKDCGNAPKKLILKNFNIALVTGDTETILGNLADHMTWTIIGDKMVKGKDAFIDKLSELHDGEITELVIHDIITHGYVASAHGKVLGVNRDYYFCHVYKFTSASKTAKIKEMTSYIIDERK